MKIEYAADNSEFVAYGTSCGKTNAMDLMLPYEPFIFWLQDNSTGLVPCTLHMSKMYKGYQSALLLDVSSTE